MSTLKFFGNGAAVVGVILVQLALVSAVILPMDTVEARRGLGQFIQASLALTALGVAGCAVGASQRS
jgi:hypothetical protein